MEKIKLFLLAAGVPYAETFMRAFGDLFQRQCLNSAGLAVGTTTTKYKIANSIYTVNNGTTVLTTTADGPVLTGYNLTSGQVGGFVACVDNAGNQSALPIQPAATIGQIAYPAIPANLVAIGLVLINTTNAATYTGGTTLMSATNVTYVNLVGPFSPLNAF